MGFIDRVMDMVKESIETQLDCDRQIAEINKLVQAGKIGAETALDEKVALKHQRDGNRVQTSLALREIETEFHEKVDEQNQLFGSMLNGDEKLLDGSIKLDENQLNGLVAKNRQNPLIIEKIRQYCSANHIFVDLPMSPEMRKNCFSDFIRAAQYAVYSPQSLQAAMLLAGKSVPCGVEIGDMTVIPMQYRDDNKNRIDGAARGDEINMSGDPNGLNPFIGCENVTLDDVH